MARARELKPGISRLEAAPQKLSQAYIDELTKKLDVYEIWMANMSTKYVIHYVGFTLQRPVKPEDVPWAQITPIPRTCDTDFQDCIKQGKMVMMATVGCGSQNWCSIEFFEPAANQWWWATYPNVIVADCGSYRGTVLGLTN